MFPAQDLAIYARLGEYSTTQLRPARMVGRLDGGWRVGLQHIPCRRLRIVELQELQPPRGAWVQATQHSSGLTGHNNGNINPPGI